MKELLKRTEKTDEGVYTHGGKETKRRISAAREHTLWILIVWIVILSVLGPVIGSAIGILKMPTFGYICNMLCFAAGVMLAISFLELIPESMAISSPWISVSGVVVGALVMYGLDKMIPQIHPRLCAQEQGCNLERTSVYLILGMFLHNFPEGMAIAIGSVTETNVSITIALAIAIHNIPEGICTSAPYYRSTGRRLAVDPRATGSMPAATAMGVINTGRV